MLGNLFFPTMSEFDDQVDQTLVPENHFVRKVARVVPWDEYQELLAPYYCQELGRPPIPPVVMLKLEYLRFHYNLSDRDVICRAQTDLAFRWFLQYPLCDLLRTGFPQRRSWKTPSVAR